jgi:hypothetical protein
VCVCACVCVCVCGEREEWMRAQVSCTYARYGACVKCAHLCARAARPRSHERAISAVGLDIVDGHRAWASYRKFERDLVRRPLCMHACI